MVLLILRWVPPALTDIQLDVDLIHIPSHLISSFPPRPFPFRAFPPFFSPLFWQPQLYASLSPAAGPCEAPGSGTLSQQKASSVLDKISAIKHIPLRQYAGKWDNTVGQSSPKQMENALEKCGATNAELIWVDSTHIDMNIKPFTVDRLQWMLKQKRGNSGSNDGKDNNDKKQENKDDDKTKSNDTNLSPIANGKASTDIKQHNTDLKDKTDDDDTTTSPTVDFTSPAPSSSSSGSKTGSCKAKTRQRRKAAKRSLGEEGYAHPGPVRRGILPKPDNELQQNSSSSSRKVKRGLTLADIISNAESLKAKEKRDTQEEEEGVKIGKRTPLESLKAHAGNRRSHSGSSSLDPKLGRRASR